MRPEDRQKDKKLEREQCTVCIADKLKGVWSKGRQIAQQYCTNNVKTLGLGGLKNRNKNKNRMDRG